MNGVMQQHRPSWHADSPRRRRSDFEPRGDDPVRSGNGHGDVDAERLAAGLGWFGIALGMAQVLAPRGVCRMIGVPERPLLMRALGMREIATGLGILGRQRPAAWMQVRVAGNAMDAALLAVALASERSHGGRIAVAGAAVAGVTALDWACSERLRSGPASRSERLLSHGSVRVVKRAAIGATPEVCYRTWRAFDRLPRFMRHLESVTLTDGKRSHWVARAPAGGQVEWDAELTEDIPNQLLAWRSVGDADVEHSGVVRFLPAPHGLETLVSVEMHYRPPGGMTGSLLARLFGESPERQVHEDLRRFKQIVETGEISTTEGQPAGPRSRLYRLTHVWEAGQGSGGERAREGASDATGRTDRGDR